MTSSFPKYRFVHRANLVSITSLSMSLLLSLLLVSNHLMPTVYAQEISQADQSIDAIQYAQDMIQEGQKRLKKKQYREAIPFFERSQQRVPDVKNLYTLGAIYKKLSNCPKALDYWTQAQKDCQNCGLGAQIDQALLQHTKACSTEVSIQSLPRALVLIDGEKLGETPYSGRLLVGTHQLELRSQGHIPYVQRVQANRDQALTLDVVLKPVGQQLGLPMEPVQIKANQNVRVQSFDETMSPPIQAVAADDWFRAEAQANATYSKHQKLRSVLFTTGVILGASALGLYSYSVYKYNVLLDLSKTNTNQDMSLANQANQAELMQNSSGVLMVLSGLTLGSLLFIE